MPEYTVFNPNEGIVAPAEVFRAGRFWAEGDPEVVEPKRSAFDRMIR